MRSKTLTAPPVGEGAEQKELSCVADENAKWYKLLWKKIVAIFFLSFFLKQTNQNLTYSSVIMLLSNQGFENLTLPRYLDKDVYSSFIQNYQNLKVTRCPSVSK